MNFGMSGQVMQGFRVDLASDIYIYYYAAAWLLAKIIALVYCQPCAPDGINR